jgi:signal transduction histidine kinase
MSLFPPIVRSLAFRLAFLYGLAVVAIIPLVSGIFYFGTVGVLARGIDSQLATLSGRLRALAQPEESGAVADEIARLLADGIASDTEIYLLAGPDGHRIVGNIEPWPWSEDQFGSLSDQAVTRLGLPTLARILPVRLPDGDVLVVGRDMPDQQEMRRLVVQALVAGGGLAIVLATLGAVLFHRRMERRFAAIRDIAAKIESGQLDWRIPASASQDEFSRLDADINRMLDRIQHLMDGVRHVSNAIAHDLRTPLGRLRARLDQALRAGDPAALPQAARGTIEGIDQLIALFERLLQIAEAESGTRRQSFAPVKLSALLATIAELFDALAEETGMTLTVDAPMEAVILGDRALLSALLVNLVENAFKYAGAKGGHIALALTVLPREVELSVRDGGPGIPAAERDRVLERFYRLDRSRSQPGNGLGLSLVAAIAALHGGRLILEDADPGLWVRIVLPRNLSKP